MPVPGAGSRYVVRFSPVEAFPTYVLLVCFTFAVVLVTTTVNARVWPFGPPAAPLDCEPGEGEDYHRLQELMHGGRDGGVYV